LVGVDAEEGVWVEVVKGVLVGVNDGVLAWDAVVRAVPEIEAVFADVPTPVLVPVEMELAVPVPV